MSDHHVDTKKIEAAVHMILEAIGEDPNREALIETPARVAQMYEEIFAGLHVDERACLSSKFDARNNEMVFVRDITFYSMCEHHLIPFFWRRSYRVYADKRYGCRFIQFGANC